MPPPMCINITGSFKNMPIDILESIFAMAIQSCKDFNSIMRTCLFFNEAAVSHVVVSQLVRITMAPALYVPRVARRMRDVFTGLRGVQCWSVVRIYGRTQSARYYVPGYRFIDVIHTRKKLSVGTVTRRNKENGLCVKRVFKRYEYCGLMRNGVRHGMGLVEYLDQPKRGLACLGNFKQDQLDGICLVEKKSHLETSCSLGSYKGGQPHGTHLICGIIKHKAFALCKTYPQNKHK